MFTQYQEYIKKYIEVTPAEWELIDKRITVDLIRQTDSVDTEVIGLGFPIYFRKAPELVIEFLNRLEG